MDKLKPCPFCGNDYFTGILSDERSVYIHCWRCGARGPAAPYEKDDCIREQLVKWWNIRRGEKDG